MKTIRFAPVFLLGVFLMLSNACDPKNKNREAVSDPDLADEYFQKAQAAFDEEDYTLAVSLLDSALMYQADHASSLTTRASAHFNLGNYQQALKDYHQAIERWPKNDENKKQLALLYLERGDTYYTLENYNDAIADFTQAIDLDPDNAIAYIYRGDARDYAGQSKEAILDYNKAIELEPANGSAYYNRAIAKKNIDDEKGACADFREALRLGFADAQPYLAACK
jgi:tetratricopeptide (TPR) repeat protein